MNPADARIAAIAATQFGLFCRAQAIAAGLTEKMINDRVRAGLLVRIHPGVFMFAAVPMTWEARLFAAQLWLGGEGVVSHRSAARLYRLPGFEHDVVELSVSGRGRERRDGVLVHRSTNLDLVDVRIRSPFRVTSIERTLADLGAVVGPPLVEAALDRALFEGLTTFERVANRLQELRKPGVRGSRVLGEVLAERDPAMAPAESIFETKFYRLLRRSSLPPHVRQFTIHDDDGFVARLDIAFPEHKVGIEAHGLRWHSGRERVKRDARRNNRLTAIGWRVVYELYEDLEKRPSAILERVERLLGASGVAL